MLLDLHKPHIPDLSKAEIKAKDITSPTLFEAELEYSCPSRGTWTIAHSPMIVPESHQIYIGASACLRGVVLSAAEYEGLNRYSMIMLEDSDILSGNLEEIFIEGVADIINKLPYRPKLVMPFTGCIHHFLATDLNYVYDQLQKRFPDIDFVSCHMFPTMKKTDYTSEELIRKSLYDALENTERNSWSINVIGSNEAIKKSSDHVSLLEEMGYTVRDLCRCETYEQYKKMGTSILNIYSMPVGELAAKTLKARLGQDFIYMPNTYNYEEIIKDTKALCDVLSLPYPSFDACKQKAQEALARAKSIIGDTKIAVDYVCSTRFLELVKLLLEHGFNVVEVYSDFIFADDEDALMWIQQHRPDLPFKATANFRSRFFPQSEALQNNEILLAIGPKAAFFTGSTHFVNMIENNGMYGFDGIVRLADMMIEAFQHEKDTRSIIQVKGWGCCA